jgi:hypothetical protein
MSQEVLLLLPSPARLDTEAAPKIKLVWFSSAAGLKNNITLMAVFIFFLYPVHVTTRKSFGLMTRKLSVTESHW